MIVRREQVDDRSAIHAVHAASFPTTMEARLVDVLRENQTLTLSLVAEVAGEVIGHVAFSPVCAPDGAEGWGLGPVAVLPAHRRQGIAAELIRAGLAICAESAVGFVVVLGAPVYYGRFGFEPASRWGLHDEFGGGDAFQGLELRAGAIPSGGGRVCYSPEFSALEDEDSA